MIGIKSNINQLISLQNHCLQNTGQPIVLSPQFNISFDILQQLLDININFLQSPYFAEFLMTILQFFFQVNLRIKIKFKLFLLLTKRSVPKGNLVVESTTDFGVARNEPTQRQKASARKPTLSGKKSNNINRGLESFLQINIVEEMIEKTETEQMDMDEENKAVQAEQPMYMFQYWTDPVSGQPRSQMIQYWYFYFGSFLQHINMLRETQNKSWKKEQLDAYLLFLHDLESYIQAYVFTGVVYDYNQFEKAMEQYGETNNKVGYDLYNHQCEYLEKKQSGYDFNLDKKKKKETTKKTQEVKPKPKEKEKEEEIVRKDDPTITASELKTKEFDPTKYANLDSFHLESANLIFIGHVDSGKSTLTGNIMKELKLVDEQELARNKQESKEKHMESWELAYIADFDQTEREKGKTLECSKMMFTTEHRRFTLFDAPGHKNYVPSMIMGACQADIAVLIISSKEGEFQSGFEKEGQTKEHAMLAKALGVQSMIAVVTKMGTNEWSQTRFNHIKTQVAPFLENSCGFAGVTFIPIDSINNQNVHNRNANAKWYKGPCLMEVLDAVNIPPRDPDGPLRIPIIDKFKEMGFFLYGKIQSGKIAYENQVVSLLPSRQYISIKQIYNARDEKLPYALAGQNVKIRVKGIEENDVNRGDILCSNNNFCQQSNEFKANLTVLELPEQKKIMSSGYQCVMHMHAISEECEISHIEAKIEKGTGKLLKATYLLPGEVGKVVIKPKNAVCLEKFEFMPSLGRFTLRDEGKTIGFGEVTKIKPAKALTKEQKDQLGPKVEGETANLTSEMQKVSLGEKKEEISQKN